MDAARFDRLTRDLASRLARPFSRRAALRAGGVGALALGAAPVLAAAQPATPAATPAAGAGAGAPVAFLLVQVAAGGSFRPTGEPDVYDLELDHAGGTTLAFADRPAREVRVIPTEEALEVMGFVPDPPNAALVTGPADGEVAVVVELLDGAYDAASGTLAYRVRALAEAARETLVGAIEARAVVAPPARFGHASLFVDDLFCNKRYIHCCKQRTDVGSIGKHNMCLANDFTCIECNYTNLWADCNATYPECNGSCTATVGATCLS